MIYVLILFAHVGLMGSGNSNALTTAERSRSDRDLAEFTSEATCKAAGDAAKAMAGGTVKNITYVCMKK